MTITARYASTCTACHQPVTPGQSIEWERGSRAVRHTDCPTATPAPATTIATGLTYETVGARVYVLGPTYPIRDAIRAAGGHWDADRKAWWIGAAKRATLETAVSGAVPASETPEDRSRAWRRRRDADHPWTGCRCGSREGLSRPSDCASCRFDENDN